MLCCSCFEKILNCKLYRYFFLPPKVFLDFCFFHMIECLTLINLIFFSILNITYTWFFCISFNILLLFYLWFYHEQLVFCLLSLSYMGRLLKFKNISQEKLLKYGSFWLLKQSSLPNLTFPWFTAPILNIMVYNGLSGPTGDWAPASSVLNAPWTALC